MSASRVYAKSPYDRVLAELRKEYAEVYELEHDSGFLVRAKNGPFIVLDANGEKLK